MGVLESIVLFKLECLGMLKKQNCYFTLMLEYCLASGRLCSVICMEVH